MTLPIELKYQIILYLPTATIIKICGVANISICRDKQFWFTKAQNNGLNPNNQDFNAGLDPMLSYISLFKKLTNRRTHVIQVLVAATIVGKYKLFTNIITLYPDVNFDPYQLLTTAIKNNVNYDIVNYLFNLLPLNDVDKLVNWLFEISDNKQQLKICPIVIYNLLVLKRHRD